MAKFACPCLSSCLLSISPCLSPCLCLSPCPCLSPCLLSLSPCLSPCPEMVTNGPNGFQKTLNSAYDSWSESTCGHFVIFASKNIAKTTVFFTTFRHVAISSFLLPKNIEFSLRFPLQIDMCKIGNFTFSKRWISLGKSHTFGKRKWRNGHKSKSSVKRNHFDHHFWTKSDEISKKVKDGP